MCLFYVPQQKHETTKPNYAFAFFLICLVVHFVIINLLSKKILLNLLLLLLCVRVCVCVCMCKYVAFACVLCVSVCLSVAHYVMQLQTSLICSLLTKM